MKNKKRWLLAAICAIAVVTAISVLGACKSANGVPMLTKDSLADHEVAPTFDAYYQTQFAQLMQAYDAGDKNAQDTAGAMWALASYNHSLSDQFVYFQDQIGTTQLDGKSGKLAYQQYHKEKRAKDSYLGEKYHYTLKHVFDSVLVTLGNFLEQARVRLVANDAAQGFKGLYRFEKNGDTVFTNDTLFGRKLMSTEWKKGSDWGNAESILKGGVPYGAENTKSYDEVLRVLNNDIDKLGYDTEEMEWRAIIANINTLADGIVSSATIERKQTAAGAAYYAVSMQMNLTVANADAASINMLKDANSATEIQWNKMDIAFEVWECGMMKSYVVKEEWKGVVKQVGVSKKGAASAENYVFYSYSDADCSMEAERSFLKAYMEEN